MSSDLAAVNSLDVNRAAARPTQVNHAARRHGVLSAGILSVVVPVFIFVLWSVAADRHWMSPQVLPTPALVFQTARELLADNLLSNLAISLRRLLIGFTSAVIAGAILGGIAANGPYGYYGPAYYGPGPYAYYGGPGCYWTHHRVWDGYGWHYHRARVCG